jgi:hypothetical protein
MLMAGQLINNSTVEKGTNRKKWIVLWGREVCWHGTQVTSFLKALGMFF